MERGRAGLQIQQRDIAFLRGLFESRVMTLGHIAALYFDGKQEACKKRVQRLKAARLVGVRKRRPYEPAIHFYTKKAHQLLHEHGGLQGLPSLGDGLLEKRMQVSDLTLRHELSVMDVKAAMMPAIDRLPALRVDEFSTWPRLFQFRSTKPGAFGARQNTLIKPDGFLRIRESVDGRLFEHLFFLEVDRSTESLDRIADRAQAYRHFYTSGGMARRMGGSPDDYRVYPFRVLFVVKSEERMLNIARRLCELRPPILTQAWLATSATVTHRPLDPIWLQPRDCQDVVAGAGRHPLFDR